jgi:ribonucleoside-diphosphate reductase alpha chain
VYRDGSRDNQVLSTGATEIAKAARGGGDARTEKGDLHGTITELHAEVERLRKALFDVEAENLQRRKKRARPDTLRGTTMRMETPLGTMFVNVTEDEKGQPFEVFINLGKAGGAAMADVEAMGRLISLSLRSGIPLQEVHKQLRGIASDRATGMGPNKVLSVPDAIGIAIENWLRQKQGVQQDLLAHGTQSAEPAPPPATLRARDAGTHAEYAFDAFNGDKTMIGTCPDCGSSLEYAEGCAKCHVCGFSECG